MRDPYLFHDVLSKSSKRSFSPAPRGELLHRRLIRFRAYNLQTDRFVPGIPVHGVRRSTPLPSILGSRRRFPSGFYGRDFRRGVRNPELPDDGDIHSTVDGHMINVISICLPITGHNRWRHRTTCSRSRCAPMRYKRASAHRVVR